MKKNLLLVDWNPKQDWPFLQGLEKSTEEEWELHSCDSSRHHGGVIQKIIHYAKLLYVPLRAILHRKQYKQVVAFHKYHGLLLAFYFKLFHLKNVPDITVMTFIYKPKSGLKGKLLKRFVSYCVKSDYIKKLVVYSKSEVPYYAKLFDVSVDKFFATNYCIEDSTNKIPIGQKGDYFLSVGRSNRDYAFLLSSWSENRKLVIINDSLKEKTENPNIEILRDCHGDDYLRLLANCHAVIIPLEDPHISSGQLVIMQAMMYGKPIIITKNETLDDYIIHGHDGIIIDKTNVALDKAIAQLEDEEYYHTMSMAERKTFYEKYSLYEFGVQTGNTLKNS
jgi:glycosyltransferase involved in cell wall biosynthesis